MCIWSTMVQNAQVCNICASCCSLGITNMTSRSGDATNRVWVRALNVIFVTKWSGSRITLFFFCKAATFRLERSLHWKPNSVVCCDVTPQLKEDCLLQFHRYTWKNFFKRTPPSSLKCNSIQNAASFMANDLCEGQKNVKFGVNIWQCDRFSGFWLSIAKI